MKTCRDCGDLVGSADPGMCWACTHHNHLAELAVIYRKRADTAEARVTELEAIAVQGAVASSARVRRVAELEAGRDQLAANLASAQEALRLANTRVRENEGDPEEWREEGFDVPAKDPVLDHPAMLAAVEAGS